MLKGFVALIAVASLAIGPSVSANVYNDRTRINSQIQQQEAHLHNLSAQVNTLQGQLAALDNSIAALNQEIQRNTAEIAVTQQKINVQEAELQVKKSQIAELVKSSYREGRATSVEMLFGSGSLAEFMSKKQYLDNTQTKVSDTAEQIKAIKKQLDAQKVVLESTRQHLEGNRQAVAVERAKQNELLAATKGQEAEYQSILASSKKQKAAIDSKIAELSRVSRSVASGPASGSVKRGQVIGYEGTTGNSTGCHLHFTVYSGGKEVNPAPLIGSGQLGAPMSYGPGNITQGFGPAGWSNPWYNFHNGMDISVGCGTPIYAAADGDIIKNVYNDGSGYGHYIIINHNNGMLSLYAHMQ